MMIDLVEEEGEIEIQVLLGDYLDNSDTYIDMQSSSTSSPTTTSSFSSLSKYQFTQPDLGLEDKIVDIVLEEIEFLQAHRYLIQRNRGIPKDLTFYQEVSTPSTPRGPLLAVTHPSFYKQAISIAGLTI